MPIQYRRGAHLVDAIRFDGTPTGVATLAAFGCRREDESCENLVVPTPCGPVYIGPGIWVLRDRGSLSVVDDDTFASFYEPIIPVRPGAVVPC